MSGRLSRLHHRSLHLTEVPGLANVRKSPSGILWAVWLSHVHGPQVAKPCRLEVSRDMGRASSARRNPQASSSNSSPGHSAQGHRHRMSSQPARSSRPHHPHCPTQPARGSRWPHQDGSVGTCGRAPCAAQGGLQGRGLQRGGSSSPRVQVGSLVHGKAWPEST